MNNKFDVNGITFISCAVCNLNCSYCYLNKNESYKSFNKLVQDAWHSGAYVNNVVESLDLLNVPKDGITTISLWGGEVLLQIEDVISNIQTIYEFFPKVDSWLISTNWMVDVNKVFNFVKTIDNNTNQNTTIVLQVSIDGPPGPISEAGHHGDWNIYRANFKKFTQLINNYKLKNVNVQMHINAVLNKEMYFKTFSTEEGMRDYMSYMGSFADEIKEQCISKSIDFISDLIYPGYATPYDDTQEDGIKLAEIFRRWDNMYQREFKQKYPHADEEFYRGIGDFNINTELFAGNMECSELSHVLTFNYDGSICECNGSYIDYYQPYLNELKAKNHMNDYLTASAHNKMTSYNPRTCSPEELEIYKYAVHNGGYRNTKLIYVHMMFSMAEALLHAGQISSCYSNKDLLYRHCLMMLNVVSCSRNNITETRVPYLTPIGALRRYLNGAMEFVDKKNTENETRKKKIFLEGLYDRMHND